ncbi:MAG: rRNA pseudouridine synthase [Parasporobacterium sp.]|nr:rRNA pseudouridine synthase [Parasporobacterium sp.]
MALLRLDKIISSTGEYSRRQVKDLIKAGKVTVNGSFPPGPESKYDPGSAIIVIDGIQLNYRTNTYIMLNKPQGVITATKDGKLRTVMDLLPDKYSRIDLFPVGRLDIDTEGLLLITDDGLLAHNLLSPGKHVDKKYYAEVDGMLTQDDCTAFSKGITLADGTEFLPGVLETVSENSAYVIIHEGKFHQVKRMLGYLGKPVTYLKRLQMGPLVLDPALKTGEYRELTSEEVNLLKNC